ncbi:MAG: BrnA antitoxin family protein [Hyphomonadaceae bacterium]|nr:BrnA antitoxin family protein [Hyphomonadaceae bacterium]
MSKRKPNNVRQSDWDAVDSPELSDVMLKQLKPARGPGRPRAINPKQSVTLRLDREVVSHFKSQGAGWQTRINATLKAAAGGAAKSKNDRLVVKHGDGWAVKAPGASRASAVTSTQKQAEARAKEIVRKQGGGEVRIHGKDGRIRDSEKKARDPYPPRNKKY